MDYKMWHTRNDTLVIENYIWPNPHSRTLKRMKIVREFSIQNNRLVILVTIFYDANPNVLYHCKPSELDSSMRMEGFDYDWRVETTGVRVYDRQGDSLNK